MVVFLIIVVYLPRGGDKIVTANREWLRSAFQRVSILSNEKFSGVR